MHWPLHIPGMAAFICTLRTPDANCAGVCCQLNEAVLQASKADISKELEDLELEVQGAGSRSR